MTDNALTLTNNAMAIMPVMDIHGAMTRRQAVIDFVKSIMVEGNHYGKIPGTDKSTLLKPGAEMLTSFFGLTPSFEDVMATEDWTGQDHGGEPFFYYRQRCKLYRGDSLVASADGSCNSWEKKYRYRSAERTCPNCEKATIRKSKYPPRNNPNAKPGWYCYAKDGGCGAEFAENDPAIKGQELGKVPNPDVAEQVNTILKMAQKRALIAATLIAVNASEFFTQDVEDMNFGVIEGEFTIESPRQPQPEKPRQAPVTRHPAPLAPLSNPIPAGVNPETGEVIDPDLFPDVPESLRRQFHAAGAKCYGDGWDDERPRLVKHITKGKATSSKDITREQMEKLIDGMNKKINARGLVTAPPVDSGYQD